MTDDVERRLREALAARADSVNESDLDPDKHETLLATLHTPASTPPTTARPTSWWRTHRSQVVLAAASVAAIGALTVTALNYNRPATTNGESVANGTPAKAASSPSVTAPAGQPASTGAGKKSVPNPSLGSAGEGFAIAGGFVHGPSSSQVSVGAGETLTLTPVFTIRNGKVTVAVEMKGTNYAALPDTYTFQIYGPRDGTMEVFGRCQSPAQKRNSNATRTFGTYSLVSGSGTINIETQACNSAGKPVSLRWQGQVVAQPGG